VVGHQHPAQQAHVEALAGQGKDALKGREILGLVEYVSPAVTTVDSMVTDATPSGAKRSSHAQKLPTAQNTSRKRSLTPFSFLIDSLLAQDNSQRAIPYSTYPSEYPFSYMRHMSHFSLGAWGLVHTFNTSLYRSSLHS